MDTNGFFEILQKQRSSADSKRRREIEAQWSKFGEIQEKDILLRIGYSSPEFFKELLSIHPARQLADSVKNVDTAFDILSRSRMAFVDLAGRFHARVVHDLHKNEDYESALREATKEIYTYSCAAESLVQAYRHMTSGRPKIEEKYNALRAEIFANTRILQFIKGLRVSNNHVHILTASPHYSITHRGEGRPEVKSGISFDRNAILDSNNWSQEAKSFVAARENIEVIEFIDEHYKLASNFKNIVLFRTGIHADKGYRDILRIEQARKTISLKVTLNLFLPNAALRKLDPYEYLDNWFTKEELEKIYSFDDHTKEQLEYMISLRDPFGFCDRHTREDLYKLFSVPLELLPEQPYESPRLDF